MQTRYSKQREEIISVLKNTKSHPTAEWIYEEVRKIDPTVSLGTVYRNLGLLCEQGLAMVVETADKKTHYDGCAEDHTHFVCRVCDRVFDVEEPCVIPKELSDKGFLVERSSCVFYGICSDCSKKQ